MPAAAELAVLGDCLGDWDTVRADRETVRRGVPTLRDLVGLALGFLPSNSRAPKAAAMPTPASSAPPTSMPLPEPLLAGAGLAGLRLAGLRCGERGLSNGDGASSSDEYSLILYRASILQATAKPRYCSRLVNKPSESSVQCFVAGYPSQ